MRVAVAFGLVATAMAVRADDALSRGAAALVALQAQDGAWRSGLYAPLRAGAGLTAYVADTLLTLPEAVRVRHADSIRRALDWLAREAGADGEPFASVESRYPTYAATYALSAFVRAGTHPAVRARLQAWLCRAQLTEEAGWRLEDRGYGGWDSGAPRPRPTATHANLSVFASVVDALDRAGLPVDHPLRGRALVFLDRCHGSGGGYGFSWHDLASNKAGVAPDGRLVDYGSATADGLIALAALRVPPESDTRRTAVERFAARFDVERVWGLSVVTGADPGVGADARPWATALRLYGLARAAEAFALAPRGPSDRRAAIADALAREQDAYGRWTGASPLMMEDDPVLATALALRALGACAR